MTDDPISRENAARANYLFARTLAVGINAVAAGLAVTAFFAVFLLWLQKSSNLELERGQYGSALVFVFLFATLCAYLVFEHLQSRKERLARERRIDATKRKPSARRAAPDPDDWGAVLEERLKAFDPIFADTPDAASDETPMPLVSPAGPAAAFETRPTVSGAPDAAALTTAPGAKTAPPRDPTADLFAQAVTAAVASLDEEPSAFMQFGVNLFVAGGSGELAKRGGLPAAQGRQMLSGMLAGLGMSPRSAEAFAANANTFAQVPHFRAPIDAGYRAMTHLIDKGFVEIAALPEVLGFWRMQDETCGAPEPVTFVATSVAVPPPGVPVAPEDRQRVIRTHKTVVTEALHRFQGRELHTLGNGCVMAFDDTTRALRAAMMCQEELDKFARANPSLVVAARIGVDTDIAATVAHDYVSAALPRTVTIAAMTPPGHIYCTEAAKNDALDMIAFAPMALGEMYADLAPLFSVAWSQAPVHVTSANPLEYRQVGALAEADESPPPRGAPGGKRPG